MKCGEGAAREDQQSLTWTRTDTSQCEVTEAVGWMLEVVPWKRGENMLRHGGATLLLLHKSTEKALLIECGE